MTAKQIYLWYCKEKGVLGNVMNMYKAKDPKDWDWYYKSSNWMSFNKYFSQRHNCAGFRGLFASMFETYAPWYKKYGKNKLYEKAKKNWNYFINHNIRVKSNFKEGDVVQYTVWGQKREGVVIRFDLLTNEFYVKDVESGRNTYTRPSSISAINGNPLILEYYIEKNGKYYGLDKE